MHSAGELISQFGDFLRYLRRRFIADHCTRAAASLAYTSLLALVPLFTVIFVTIAAFPAFQDWRTGIEDLVFQQFVPALGEQVRGYLGDFTDKAKGLRAAGIAILVVTVLAMMSTIESTFNVIWGVQRKRPVIVRFLVYWAVLTLGPLLIGASMVATSYVVSFPLLSGSLVAAGLKARILSAFPVLSTTLAFTLFFQLIPYRPVPVRHALTGGIVASCLFEIAKGAFAYYVTHFPTQQAVYGAFATVPIFLIWIYLSWIIVLLGAEITQCLTTYQAVSRRQSSRLAGNPVYVVFRVLVNLYEAQSVGRGLSDKALLRSEPGLDYDTINKALEILDKARWISRNDTFQWVLLRDLHRETLVDLMRIAPTIVQADNVKTITLNEIDERFVGALNSHSEWVDEKLAVPLADFITPAGGDGSDGGLLTQGQ